MSLRLGFHYHVPAYAVHDGNLYMPGHLGRFVDSLAEYCRSVTCFLHSPPPEEQSQMDTAIRSPNVHWVDLGRHTSVPNRMLRARQISRPVRDRLGDLDAMLIRGPSPLLPTIANTCGSLPLALLLVGDYVALLDDLRQPAWRLALIRLWSHWNKAQQLSVARRSITFVNSQVLYDELRPVVPHLVETRTTTLSEGDFYIREDTCQSLPYHLLYTGRMARGKGLADMVEAVALLASRGIDVILDLVGWPEKGDPILSEILSAASQMGIAERVVYHGFKPVGPELFYFYKHSDIYLIASRSSEGFPRTIWEAMAHSLPVVATRVGSIPAYIEGSAELVNPKDVEDLTSGIIRVIDNPRLRRTLISNGLRLAKENTLETQVSIMVKHIERWVNRKHE